MLPITATMDDRDCHGCERQAGKEYCEIKVEQNGKLAFKDVDLRERVVAGVKSCTTQAANPPSIRAAAKSAATIANGKSFNPAYLNEMPSVDRVKEAMTTNDPHETALRQIWAFYELMEVVKVLSGPREFARPVMLPDEQKILVEYQHSSIQHQPGGRQSFSEQQTQPKTLTYHFSRWDTKFGFKGVNIWQFFSEGLQSQFAQIVGADNARYAAKRAEEKRVASRGVAEQTPQRPQARDHHL